MVHPYSGGWYTDNNGRPTRPIGSRGRQQQAHTVTLDQFGVPDPAADAEYMIRRAMHRELDPVVFALDGGFHPDPWQAKFLRSEHKSKLLNCSRQTGKSTIVSKEAAHSAIYDPGSLILILAAGERQSMELMRKVYDTYRDSVDAVPLVHESMSELETITGSRIIALPAKQGTVRGYSKVNKLILDEAAQVPDELYMSVLPMMAVSGGSTLALSSPFGSRGWWYEEVRRAQEHRKAQLLGLPEGLEPPPWDYYEVPAAMCPRITPAYLARMWEIMGEWWYRQEFNCEFMNPQNSAFTIEDIDRMFEEEVMAWAL